MTPGARCRCTGCALVPFQPVPGSTELLSKEPAAVPRRVKDFIDISEYTSLDDLIRYLETIRDNLPEGCEAEMKIRGDEIFGKRLTIQYFREQTPDEAELEAKYGGSSEDDGSIEQLRRRLDQVPYSSGVKKRA